MSADETMGRREELPVDNLSLRVRCRVQHGALGATFAGVDPIVTYYVCVVPTLPIIVERYR